VQARASVCWPPGITAAGAQHAQTSMDTHTRARIKREVEYLANRLAREETERHHAKERENEHKFLQLSRNSTLIKVRAPSSHPANASQAVCINDD